MGGLLYFEGRRMTLGRVGSVRLTSGSTRRKTPQVFDCDAGQSGRVLVSTGSHVLG